MEGQVHLGIAQVQHRLFYPFEVHSHFLTDRLGRAANISDGQQGDDLYSQDGPVGRGGDGQLGGYIVPVHGGAGHFSIGRTASFL